MSLKVHDLMTAAVYVVNPELSLPELERTFVETGVGALPVTDRDYTLLGVVTHSDIVRQLVVEQAVAEAASDYYRDVHSYTEDTSQLLQDIAAKLGHRMEHLKVRDVMVRTLITIAPDATIPELAALMVQRHIHRVLVCQGKKLVGIISALDLVRLLVSDERSPG